MIQQVSQKTKKLLYDAEAKSPGKVTVVIENGDPGEEEITNFEQVPVKDVTAQVLGVEKLGKSIVKENKKNMKEKNFITLFVFNDKLKKFSSKKNGKEYLKVILTHDKEGNRLNRPKEKFYILTDAKHMYKKQKDGASYTMLWAFEDEEFIVFRDKYIEEDKQWINAEKLKSIDAKVLKTMLGNK